MRYHHLRRAIALKPRLRLFAIATLVALLTIIAACVEADDTGDDVDSDDHQTVEIGGTDDEATDDENGVPPLYDISEAASDDGERRAAIVTYGQQPTDHMAALLEGELALDGTCLGVETDFEGGFVSVVWPQGFTVGFENGGAILIDDAGDTLATEGERISMGGGNSPGAIEEIAEIAPEDCISDGYWMSGPDIQRLAPETEPDPAIDDELTVYFPQWDDEDPSEAGSFGGRLVLENECLYLDHEQAGQQRLAIWPPDWGIEADGEDVILLDENGDERARTGDILSVESNPGQFDMDQYGVPGACQGMHALIFDVEVTGGPDDEMPEAHVQTEEEAREQDAQMYADAFDVDLDEALRRLDLQSRLPEENVTLEQDEPDRFGGMHWEHEPEYRLVVLMTDGDEEVVREQFSDPDLLEVLEVRAVEHTQQELHQTQREVTELLTDLGVRVSSGTSIQENRVEIYVSDASVVEDALEAAGETLPDYVVIVEEEEAEAEPMDDTKLDNS